jgi:TRAP-type C4-dicarboxylate transport system substrate-binding protein
MNGTGTTTRIIDRPVASPFNRVLCVLGSALLVATVAGCTARDRAGGQADADVQVLSFAQPNDGEPPDQLVVWASEVNEASGGTLEIEFENGYRLGEPAYESATVQDIRDGRVDMGWVGARALDRAGITTFQALLAPMLVDSQELQAAVFEEGIPDEMLAEMEGDGVVGVGVLPGPLRKVLGIDRPFLTPEDFQGAVVGMQDSGVAELTFEALGASAEALPSGVNDLSGVDAYEQQLQSIWGNQYQVNADYLTSDLNLWPRPLVLLVGEDAYDGLTDEQQGALAAAGKAAVLPALDASAAEDAENVDDVCSSGIQVDALVSGQREALEDAVAPVYHELRTDAATDAWLDRIAGLKADLGAEPDGMDCSGSSSAEAGALPNGTYRTSLTVADVAKGCPEGAPGSEPLLDREQVDRTLEFTVDGDRIVQTEYPVGQPELREPGWQGTYRTFRDTLELAEGGSVEPLSMTWDFDGSQLTLSRMRTEFCDHKTIWTSHPWRFVQPPGDAVEGNYQMVATWSETEPAGCPPGGEEGTADEVIYDLSLRDGRLEMWVRIGGPDAPKDVGIVGDYSVFRDRLELTNTDVTLSMRFEVDDEAITFSDLEGGECGDVTIMTSLPWQRVADESAQAGLVGTWTTRLSAADWAPDDGPAGSFTLVFGEDGRVTLTDPFGDVGFHGDYDRFRDRLEVTGGPDDLAASVRIDGDVLVFSDLTVGGNNDASPYQVVWESHPWRRA